MGSQSLFQWPPSILPESMDLSVYVKIFTERPVFQWLQNTALVSFSTAIFCTRLRVGYALSRFNIRLTNGFSLLIMVSQMLPAALIVVPLYVIFRQAGLYNSLLGLAIADLAFTLPLATWLMKGFFDRIPADLEEQAQIDGCGRLEAFYRVNAAARRARPRRGGGHVLHHRVGRVLPRAHVDLVAGELGSFGGAHLASSANTPSPGTR